MKFGIGTYSFGGMARYLGLGEPLVDVFKKIRSFGFEQAEILSSDLLGNSVDEMIAAVKESGVEIVSIHMNPTEEVIDKMAAVGAKAVICASASFCNKAEAIETALELEKMAEYAETKGIKVGYHNHSSEFFIDEGKSLLEHMIDATSKLMFQLDCGWAMNAGMHPASFIRRNPGRILAIHVKENCKVNGPGPRPTSRYAEVDHSFGLPANPFEVPVEDRQKILEGFEAMFAGAKGTDITVQCPIAAPESNIDWKEIKAALDETNPEAFWIVEREEFYTEHDQCIKDDANWLLANIH